MWILKAAYFSVSLSLNSIILKSFLIIVNSRTLASPLQATLTPPSSKWHSPLKITPRRRNSEIAIGYRQFEISLRDSLNPRASKNASTQVLLSRALGKFPTIPTTAPTHNLIEKARPLLPLLCVGSFVG